MNPQPTPPTVINRTSERAAFRERLDLMRRGDPVFECVLFVHGVSNVGKTTLLNEMRREAKGLASAQIDFDREQHVDGRLVDDLYDGERGRVQVAKELLAQLSASSGFLPRGSIDAGLTDGQAAERLLGFINDLYRYTLQRPFVLMFDTIEDSDLTTFVWTQERILAQLLDRYRVLIAIAGRTPPNTVQRDLIYPLERRTEKLALRPFEAQDTLDQLAALGANQISLDLPDLAHYTGGLPGLNEAAAQRWLAGQRSTEQLSSHLVNAVILKRYASQVTREVQAELFTLSVLRQFDSLLLRELMDALWESKYDSGIGPVRTLLRKLQQTRLVEPHPDGYGYTVPHDLRLVLDRYWQDTDPVSHLCVHRIAARWFKKQVAEGDYVAIADRIYHLGGIWRDLEEHADLECPIVPDESELRLPKSPVETLLQELEAALQQLDDALKQPEETRKQLGMNGYRAFDLVNKIQTVLKQPEFVTVLKPETIDALVERCVAFSHTLDK